MTWFDKIFWHLSGASLTYYLWKRLGGKEHYDCPRCHNEFEGQPGTCPVCNSKFRWS